MYDFKHDLLAGAQALEMETAGFLPAASYTKIIDQGIVPLQRPGDGELVDFLPIVMSVDANNAPSEAPDHMANTRVGAVACLPDRAIFAWLTGRLILKVHSYTLDYSRIKKTNPIAMGHIKGIDIFERTTWTVMFADQLRADLIEDLRKRLLAAISQSPGGIAA